MKALRKLLLLAVSIVSLTAYTLPALASGNVDATLSEYIKFEPNKAPIAEAVISNRSTDTATYVLEVMDFNGASLEQLATGTLAPGETKIISGTATVLNKSSIRVKVAGANGLVAVDTAWLLTRY